MASDRSSGLRNARETVIADTPAWAATSSMRIRPVRLRPRIGERSMGRYSLPQGSLHSLEAGGIVLIIVKYMEMQAASY